MNHRNFLSRRTRRTIAMPFGLVVTTLALLAPMTGEAQLVTNTIANPNFSAGDANIDGELTLLGPSSTVGPQALAGTSWYGRANHTNAALNLAGFRPGIEINHDSSSTGNAEINYALGASLGGLLGLEMPEAQIWQPLTGQSLVANRTYTLSATVTTTSFLNLAALSARGFGIGVTTGATATSSGTMYRNTVDNPTLASLTLLGGNTNSVSLTFTTGSSVTAGVLGIVIFAGHGTQDITLDLLTTFHVTNVQLSSVPEPSTTTLVGAGIFILLAGRRISRTVTSRRKN